MWPGPQWPSTYGGNTATPIWVSINTNYGYAVWYDEAVTPREDLSPKAMKARFIAWLFSIGVFDSYEGRQRLQRGFPKKVWHPPQLWDIVRGEPRWFARLRFTVRLGSLPGAGSVASVVVPLEAPVDPRAVVELQRALSAV